MLPCPTGRPTYFIYLLKVPLSHVARVSDVYNSSLSILQMGLTLSLARSFSSLVAGAGGSVCCHGVIGGVDSGLGQLHGPASLVFDDNNHILVCDYHNQRLQVCLLVFWCG